MAARDRAGEPGGEGHRLGPGAEAQLAGELDLLVGVRRQGEVLGAGVGAAAALDLDPPELERQRALVGDRARGDLLRSRASRPKPSTKRPSGVQIPSAPSTRPSFGRRPIRV